LRIFGSYEHGLLATWETSDALVRTEDLGSPAMSGPGGETNATVAHPDHRV